MAYLLCYLALAWVELSMGRRDFSELGIFSSLANTSFGPAFFLDALMFSGLDSLSSHIFVSPGSLWILLRLHNGLVDCATFQHFCPFLGGMV